MLDDILLTLTLSRTLSLSHSHFMMGMHGGKPSLTKSRQKAESFIIKLNAHRSLRSVALEFWPLFKMKPGQSFPIHERSL